MTTTTTTTNTTPSADGVAYLLVAGVDYVFNPIPDIELVETDPNDPTKIRSCNYGTFLDMANMNMGFYSAATGMVYSCGGNTELPEDPLLHCDQAPLADPLVWSNISQVSLPSDNAGGYSSVGYTTSSIYGIVATGGANMSTSEIKEIDEVYALSTNSDPPVWEVKAYLTRPR